jgi:hypothetical protein
MTTALVLGKISSKLAVCIGALVADGAGPTSNVLREPGQPMGLLDRSGARDLVAAARGPQLAVPTNVLYQFYTAHAGQGAQLLANC